MLFQRLILLFFCGVSHGLESNPTLFATVLQAFSSSPELASAIRSALSCVEKEFLAIGWNINFSFNNQSGEESRTELYGNLKNLSNSKEVLYLSSPRNIGLFALSSSSLDATENFSVTWINSFHQDKVVEKAIVMLETVSAIGLSKIGIVCSSEGHYRYMAQAMYNSVDIYGISISCFFSLTSESRGNVRELFKRFSGIDQQAVILLCSPVVAKFILNQASEDGTLLYDWVWYLPGHDTDLFKNIHRAQQILTFTPTKSSTPSKRISQQCNDDVAYCNKTLEVLEGLYFFASELNGLSDGDQFSRLKNMSGREFVETQYRNFFSLHETPSTTANYSRTYEILLRRNGTFEVEGLWTPSHNSSEALTGSTRVINSRLFPMPETATSSSVASHAVLDVITLAAPPFLMISQNAEGHIVYSGYAFELFESIVSNLGISVRYRVSASGVFGERNPVSGLWTGLIGELADGRADVAVTALTITAERQEVASFTPSFFKTKIKCIVNSHQAEGTMAKHGGYAFAQPFTMLLWSAVCLTAVAMAFYLLLVSKLSPYGAYGHYFQSEKAEASRERLARRRSSVLPMVRRSSWSLFGKRSSTAYLTSSQESDARRKQFTDVQPQDSDEDDDDLIDQQTAQRHMSLSNALFFAFAGMLWQSPETVPRAPSTRIPAGVWYMVGVILVTTYTANLVMFASLTMDPSTLLSVRGLVSQRSVQIGTLQDSSVNTLIMSSDLKVAEKVQEAILRNPAKSLQPNRSVAMDLVESGKLAFVWDGAILNHIALQTDCRLTTVDLGFGVASYGFATKKDSPFLERISTELERLKEIGYLNLLGEKYFADNKRCQVTKDQIRQQTDVPLTYDSMSGAFGFLIFASGESMIVLVVEWVVASWKDVDRRDPTKPATFRRALYLRWTRMLRDARRNWLPFKKFRRHLWRRLMRRKTTPKSSMLKTRAPARGIQPNQWERYTSSSDAVNLRPGLSISDPFVAGYH